MEIDVVRKFSELVESRRLRTDRERVADVYLADPYAMFCQVSDRAGGFLEFDREMARVVIDTQVRIQPLVARMFLAQTVEEFGGFDAVLKKPQRFRFEA